MRKLFITIAIVLATATCFGETTEKSNLVRNGNTFSIERTTKSTTTKEKQPDVAIGAQWEDEEGSYDIYMGAKGGLYYYKVAKTGKHAGILRRMVNKVLCHTLGKTVATCIITCKVLVADITIISIAVAYSFFVDEFGACPLPSSVV